MYDTANEDIILNEDSGYTKEIQKAKKAYRITEKMTLISKEIGTLGGNIPVEKENKETD